MGRVIFDKSAQRWVPIAIFEADQAQLAALAAKPETQKADYDFSYYANGGSMPSTWKTTEKYDFSQ